MRNILINILIIIQSFIFCLQVQSQELLWEQTYKNDSTDATKGYFIAEYSNNDIMISAVNSRKSGGFLFNYNIELLKFNKDRELLFSKEFRTVSNNIIPIKQYLRNDALECVGVYGTSNYFSFIYLNLLNFNSEFFIDTIHIYRKQYSPYERATLLRNEASEYLCFVDQKSNKTIKDSLFVNIFDKNGFKKSVDIENFNASEKQRILRDIVEINEGYILLFQEHIGSYEDFTWYGDGTDETRAKDIKIQIVKLSKNFEILWQKSFDKSHKIFPKQILRTKQGFIVLSKYNYRSITEIDSTSAISLIFFDDNFNEIKEVKFGHNYNLDSPVKLIQTRDDGFLLGARFKETAQPIFYLIKIDSTGCLDWEYTWGDKNGDNSMSDLIESADGNFIITGFISHYLYMAKIKNKTTDIITDEKYLQNRTIYPNPASVFIEIKQETNQPVAIYSVLGIKLLESEYTDKIDVSGFPPGIYFVCIGDKVSKFVKI